MVINDTSTSISRCTAWLLHLKVILDCLVVVVLRDLVRHAARVKAIQEENKYVSGD